MAVPVIDLSGETSQVVDEVGRACREIGFLTVVGHGVPDEIVQSTAEAARTFFDLPDEEKLALTRGEEALGLPSTVRSEARASPRASAGRPPAI